MAQVKIITDSTCDLPAELLEELDITVVPLYAIFGEESFKEGVELPVEKFYDMLQSSPHHPHTSQPTPEDFSRVYDEFEGRDIVSIHLSSELSGTCESALAAKKGREGQKIEIVDTLLCSVALGAVVVKAARAAKAGEPLAEVKGIAEAAARETGFIFSVDTLEYLRKGGRIGKARELIGSLLKVKPILSLDEGKVVPKGQVPGKAKVFNALIDIMKENGADEKKVTVLLAGIQNEERIEAFRARIKNAIDVDEFIVSKVGAVIGTHTGPGVVMCSWL